MRYDAAPDDVANAYRKLIRENIDYDSLVIVYSYDRELIDGYYQAEVQHDMPELAGVLLAGLVLLQRKIADTFLV